MKAVTLPVNVLVILSIGIVVLLGLINLFGGARSGFGGLKSLLQDLTGQMDGKSKTARCKEICREIDNKEPSDSFNIQDNFCEECYGDISCNNLYNMKSKNYCELSQKEKSQLKRFMGKIKP